MKVLNIHKRIINQPKIKLSELMSSLSLINELIIDTEKWPAIILDDGLMAGSKGGHGPIRYAVNEYDKGEFIQFKFRKPRGFNGIHTFELTEINSHATELKHTIDMVTTGSGTLIWSIAIRWLHDAYIEDAFDKVENRYSDTNKKYKWTLWVKILRAVMKPGKK